MKVKPLGNRIIIKQDDVPEERVTKAGIIVPDVDGIKKQNVQTGVVVEVGPGSKNKEGKYIPSIIQKGDWVVYNHHALLKCDILTDQEETSFVYISENDIVAIIEKE